MKQGHDWGRPCWPPGRSAHVGKAGTDGSPGPQPRKEKNESEGGGQAASWVWPWKGELRCLEEASQPDGQTPSGRQTPGCQSCPQPPTPRRVHLLTGQRPPGMRHLPGCDTQDNLVGARWTSLPWWVPDLRKADVSREGGPAPSPAFPGSGVSRTGRCDSPALVCEEPGRL